MTDRLTVGQMFSNRVLPAGAGRITPEAQSAQRHREQTGTTFESILQTKQTVQFSRHAEVRLKQRGIELRGEQLSKLESAIDKAAAKGAKDSLIVMNDTAMIVNVKNRTVVTAMDGASMTDNVFTQIDSAIIIR